MLGGKRIDAWGNTSGENELMRGENEWGGKRIDAWGKRIDAWVGKTN